jgi:hypothetical protein
MILRISLLMLLISSSLLAQHHEEGCGSVKTPDASWEFHLQSLIASSPGGSDKSRNAVYTIPVIFHIIHAGEAVGNYPNITAGQIAAQIEILNEDFSAQGFNHTLYPLNAFSNWAINQGLPAAHLDSLGRVKMADFQIEFCLAHLGPNGQTLAEPGIERINWQQKLWPNPVNYTNPTTFRQYLDSIVKPGSFWDPVKYMNIWVCDRDSGVGYAGYGLFPALSGLPGGNANTGDSVDGIWLYPKSIGSPLKFAGGIYATPNVRGRVAVHEAGHYLGLRHIWGDTLCGNDFCIDTPPASSENLGNPNYPHGAGSCSTPSNNPDGEMFMNFMDYTAGMFTYMFTESQRIRAHTAMQNSPNRKLLGTHGLCETPTALSDDLKMDRLRVYPNPAQNMIRVNIAEADIKSMVVMGIDGSRLINLHDKNECNISHLPKGMYILKVTTTKGQLLMGRFLKE